MRTHTFITYPVFAITALALLAACQGREPTTPIHHVTTQSTAAGPATATASATCEKTWVAAQDGRWVDPWNWSPAGEPLATDDVCFPVPGNYAVDLELSEVADSVWVGSGVSLALRVNAPSSTLTVSEEIVVAPTASLTFSPALEIIAQQLINDGTVVFDDLDWVNIDAIENRALMETRGRLHQVDRLINTGDLHLLANTTIEIADDFDMAAGRVLGAGRLTITPTAVLEVTHLTWRGGAFPMRADPRDSASVRIVNGDVVLANRSIGGALDVKATSIPWNNIHGDIPPTVDLTLEEEPLGRLYLRPLPSAPTGNPVLIEGRIQGGASSYVVLGAVGPVINRGVIHSLGVDLRLLFPTLENRGTIRVDAPMAFDGASTGALRNLGTIAATGADTLRITRGSFIAEPGGRQLAALDILAMGRVEGSGVAGRVRSEGTIAPGPGLATLTFDELQLRTGSRVTLEAAGPAAFDRLAVLGSARYAGELEVVSLGSFVGGQCGQRFTMLSDHNGASGAPRGAFDTFTGPPVGSRRGWHAQYLRDSVVVSGYDPDAVLSMGPIAGAVVEGGSAGVTASLCLGTPVNGANVTATLSGARGQLAVTPSAVTFTRNDWALPQRITLSAIDDAASEGVHADTVRGVLSAAPATSTVVSGGHVVITDNELPVDLAVSMVWANPNEEPGQPFERRFRVTNNGAAPSTGSVLVIPALAGATYQSSVFATCAMNGSDLECPMPALAPGGAADVVIILVASTTSGAYPLSARVRGRDWDNVSTNDRLDWVLTIP